VGRALGIGVRVASNMVRQRVAQAAAAPPTPGTAAAPQPPEQAPPPRAPVSPPVQRPVPGPSKTATAKRGAKAFGQAVLGPFTHAGSILWLEITGLFFALFALFFVQSVYRVHTAWRQGPEHAHLLLYCLLALGFGWFSVSSFARAYRKNKRGPQGRETAARR
jgi:hypothetical protein